VNAITMGRIVREAGLSVAVFRNVL